MTAAQQQAADPRSSVWVSASAGTGKTHTLTARTLRLLLHGAAHASILCVTFTKAAAAEMTERISAKLEELISCGDEAVSAFARNTGDAVLTALPPEELRRRAALAWEHKNRLRVETLHAFCAGLLEEFAPEAGFSPGIALADETETAALMRECFFETYGIPAKTHDNDTQAALTLLLQRAGTPSGATALILRLAEALPAETAETLSDPQAYSAYIKGLRLFLGAPEDETDNGHIFPEAETRAYLYGLLTAVAPGNLKITDSAGISALSALTAPNARVNAAAEEEYINCFLTKDFTPRKTLLTKGAAKQYPELESALYAEQSRVAAEREKRAAALAAHASAALIRASLPVLRLYDEKKRALNMMSYSDMIRYASALLRGEGGAEAALYRLDSRIKHILLDEAQDTAPEQWEIIDALTGGYLEDAGAGEQHRTLFVVGDEKQSIYRFQGADPAFFRAMYSAYYTKFTNRFGKNDGRMLKRVFLNDVFRCAPAILRFTDAVFSGGYAANVTDEYHQHVSGRTDGIKGEVCVHPLLQAEKRLPPAEDAGRWLHYALHDDSNAGAADTLAAGVADIALHLTTREENRFAPEEILILLQKRGTLANALRRELSLRGLSAAPPDRIRPMRHLIAKDLLAYLAVCIMPERDLDLAALLRSPFFGIDDVTLERFCVSREEEEESLYAYLARIAPEDAEAARVIHTFTRRAAYARAGVAPFFLRLLYEDGMIERYRARFPGEADTVIDNVLEKAYAFDARDNPAPERFLAEASADAGDIKREAGEQEQGIRIMTVHGAKGLQSKAVIIADAPAAPDREDALLFSDTQPPYPLFVPAKADCPPALAAYKERLKAEDKKEKLRLLYVALTRAADSLHIAAALPANRKAPPAESWYALAEAAQQHQ